MKKKGWLFILVAALAALLGFSAMATGCNTAPESVSEDFVDYYGCPNSKRVRRLNTKKTREA